MNGIPQKGRTCGPASFSRLRLLLAAMAVVFAFGFRAGAFSLLGPYADWMQETNGFRAAGEIGGPMDITEGYRWNVPVVTYGFDQTFLDFFGTQGVAAVESAIKVINDLPPASQINLTNYPLNSLGLNFRAEANSLIDLKSSVLYLLMEHLGLAPPIRNIFVVRRWDPFVADAEAEAYWPSGTLPDYILERSFDPETLRPSQFVNGALFEGQYFQYDGQAFVFPFNVDPYQFGDSVADGFYDRSPFGAFRRGLTYDDVGGLRYLLSRTNVNYEHLLGDVRAENHPGRRRHLVNGAWRPGVEKITFARQPFDGVSGRFVPLTIRYVDSYIVSGVTRHQNVKRVVRQPDILFCVGDNGPLGAWLSLFDRTGTTNWLNNAALNGSADGTGPGVIQPQVKITFQKLGPLVISEDSLPNTPPFPMSWGTFDGTTNAPIQYPAGNGAGAGGFMVRLRLSGGPFGTGVGVHTWHVAVPPGGQAALQSSINLSDWASVATVTNNGTIVEWQHVTTTAPMRFFRVVPQ